jgi:superfamily II DNA or RNA helicase
VPTGWAPTSSRRSLRGAADTVPSLAELQLRACRARLGRSALGASVPTTIGTIALRSDQREAVARVRRHLDRSRGCLLANDVGRGKTFVALTVAQRWSRVVVVIPASLRDTWADAMRRAGVEYPVITHEALSRGPQPHHASDGVIVDESHHFRNIKARRYGALAALTAHAEVLMLSATPIQNSARDLAAQLAMFLGSGAMARTNEALVRHVVRVERSAVDSSMPTVLAPRWRTAGVDDAHVLRAILDLPPPPRALDAGDAGALRTMSLVRAWASSRAALASTLARRRRSLTVIEQSLDDGRMPTRAELRRWHGGDDACMQLGFASLLVAGRPSEGLPSLRDAVCVEHEALDTLAALLRSRPDVDHHRAGRLAAIADEHAGVRLIAFTEFASTARAYYSLLRARPHVALLTASDARIASGRITRRELLARFAPSAQGYAEPPLRERIELVVGTDLLSEGVNLQDAGVVVHLDLPWNPARLAQRVGRLRRPYGCATVAAYLIAPPADAALLLGVEARLRRKLAVASRAIGCGVNVVPALSPNGAAHCADVGPGLAAQQDAVESRLARWACASASAHRVDKTLLVAGVHGSPTGWLALLSDGRLLACACCARRTVRRERCTMSS